MLMNNGHQVETCNDGVHALQAIQRRTGEGKAYDVVLAAYRLAGMDAIRLFTELRMQNLSPQLAMCTKAGGLTPQFRSEALRLNCKTFFDYPIPLNELNNFINSAANKKAQDDGPYFGTSKIGGSEISGGHKISPSTDTINQQTGYTRQGTGAFNVLPGAHTTKRVRRGIGGSFTEAAEQQQAPPPGQAPLPPAQTQQQQQQQQDQYFPQTSQFTKSEPAPQQQQPPQQQQQPPNYAPQTSNFNSVHSTQRVRRSTTGTFGNDQQNPPTAQVAQPANYQVACAHCQQAFVVFSKAQEYNAVCIHCGGLNRILPRT